MTLAFFAPIATGCISNEYVIPTGELGRLAELPPATRGQRVHAIQGIGSRRSDAIEPPAELHPEAPDDLPAVEADGQVDLRFDAQLGDVGPDEAGRARGDVGPRPGRGGDRGASAGPNTRVGPSPGRPPVARGPVVRGTPSTSPHGSAGGSVRGGGSSGGWSGGGGGGGGGNIGEAAVLLAVVVIVVAALAMVGLVASEGVRFDGSVEMSPAQPVHLRRRGGDALVMPLAEVTQADVAATVEAKVMDDEGFGIRRLEHHLDRRGATFKLDLGRMAFQQAAATVANSGPVAHLQLGYFLTSSFGLVATAGLGGADDGLGAILTRHELGLELQGLPLALGPVHLGGYANGGFAMAATTAGSGSAQYGSAFGAGALVEVDLTGRMALTLRAGGDLAHFDQGWSPAATVAGGIAIY